MPDKRDMHKAKSHRNSKSSRQAEPRADQRSRQVDSETATATAIADPIDMTTERMGKKNKSKR